MKAVRCAVLRETSQIRNRSCKKGSGIARDRGAWEVAGVAVEGKIEEQLVFEDGAADSTAPYLANIGGLDGVGREDAR